MKKALFLVFILLFLGNCSTNYNVKSKKTQLGSVQLVDGSIQIENPKLKVVISPKFGGRVISLQDKGTSEEVVQTVNPKSPNRGGAFYDIVDLNWPGEGVSAYSVQSVGLSKSQDQIKLVLTRTSGLGELGAKTLLITKTYTLDDFSASLDVKIDVKNISGEAIKLSYWNQSRPILGKAETNARKTWIRLNGELTNLAFVPLSGNKDGVEMVPQDGFVAQTARASKLAAIWTFDPKEVSHFWSWNEKDVATFDFVYRTREIKPGESTDYHLKLSLIPAVRLLSDVNASQGIAGFLDVKVKNGTAIGEAQLFKYSKDKLTGLQLTAEILGPSGEVAQVLKKEDVPALFPAEMFKTEFQEQIATNIRGGHYRVRLNLQNEEGDVLYSTMRVVNVGPLKLPKKSKDKLKVVMMWQVHLPVYSDITKSKKSVQKEVENYRTLIALYNKHPKMKADIAISGVLLYQLAQFYPDVIEGIKGLIKRKQWTIIGTAFAMPLFPFISSKQLNYQIQLDAKVKQFLLGVKPIGGMMSEMAFRDGFFDALFKNDIRWIYFAQGPLQNGYKDIPGLDYQQPSKLISTGYPMNILLQDRTLVNIMRSDFRYKTDEVMQYMMEVNAKNDKKKVLVFADKVENYSNLEFLDRLFGILEKTKWVKQMSGEEVFKTYEPTQTFLGEKIQGDWNTLPDEKGDPFARYFETSKQRDLWEELSNKEAQVLGVADKIKQAEDFGSDVSYPRSLLNEVWQNLLISGQSDWFISQNEKELSEAADNLTLVKEKTAEVYVNLMKILKDEELSIPLVSEVGAPVESALQTAFFTKMPSDLFEVKDVKIEPSKPTPVSAVNLYFTIYDKKNGIDYNNVYVVYHINDTDKYFRTKATLMFDGRMKAFLGKSKAGFKVEYFIYAKDEKNNPSVSQPYSYSVPKE